MLSQFPIKTSTACQLKWTWSTIHLYTGETNSCHRVNTVKIPQDNFDRFHNLDKKISDRRLMLEGKWPSGGCEYCKNIEASGGQSDRQFHIQIPGLSPPELDSNALALEVTPRIVEVYLDNVCNMKCIYCWDGFSSSIQQENQRFGAFSRQGVEIKNRADPVTYDLSDKFWNWMHAHYSSLRRFHVLGGEPFFQPSFDRCMQFLESHHNPDLELNIISNLKISRSKLNQHLERFRELINQKRIKRFDLTCSIDCWGAEQEYIRHGIDMDQWQDNFDLVATQPWIYLNINQTITSLGIKTIPKLLEFINHHRKQRSIGHYFMNCVTPAFLDPGIFGPGFFDRDIENILAVMPDDTWQHKNARQMMQGLRVEWNSRERNPALIADLRIFLDEIDRRRGLDWISVFPWLERTLHHVV